MVGSLSLHSVLGGVAQSVQDEHAKEAAVCGVEDSVLLAGPNWEHFPESCWCAEGSQQQGEEQL